MMVRTLSITQGSRQTPQGGYLKEQGDLHETPRGPSPDQGPPPLKMASPYLPPPWSNIGVSKMYQITSKSCQLWRRHLPGQALLEYHLSISPPEKCVKCAKSCQSTPGQEQGTFLARPCLSAPCPYLPLKNVPNHIKEPQAMD